MAGLTLDPEAGQFRLNGLPLHLGGKEFALLHALFRQAGSLCTKDQIAAAVWPEVSGAISDYNIAVLVRRVREKVEANAAKPSLLLTVRGRGYQLNLTGEIATAVAEAPRVDLLALLRHSPLVGRQRELAAARLQMDEALRGSPRVLVITGEAGIGKTRLAEELTRYAPSRGAMVLRASASQHEQVPYLPFIDLLRHALRPLTPSEQARLVAPGSEELVKLLPELAESCPDLSGVGREADRTGPGSRRRLLDAYAGFLRRLAAISPLVVVLDDLHWVDPASLTLLGALMDELVGARLLFVAIYRDLEIDGRHPLTGVLNELNRQRLLHRIRLERLSEQETRRLIEALFALNDVTDEFVVMIHQRCAGNPFFIQDVLKSLVEQEVIFWSQGRWRRREIDAVAIPDTLRAVLEERLARLPESCREVLTMAAVVGPDVPFTVLQTGLDMAEDDLLDPLERAEAAHIIATQPGDWVPRYQFTHPLIREVLYTGLSDRRRRLLHQRVGETLERLWAGHVDEHAAEVAHHFLCGTDDVKAIHYALRAGDAARRLYSHETALSSYGEALKRARSLGLDEAAALAHEGIGQALAALGELAGALDAFGRAVDYWEAQGQPAAMARLKRLMARVQMHAVDDLVYGEVMLREALDLARRQPDDPELAMLYLDTARTAAHQARVDEAEAVASKGLEMARRIGARRVELRAQNEMSLVYLLGCRWDEFFATGREIERLLVQVGDGYERVRYSFNRGYAYRHLGDLARYLEWMQRAMKVAREVGDVGRLVVVQMGLADALLLLGHWQEAREELAVAERMSSRLGQASSFNWLARVPPVDGDWERAYSEGKWHLTESARRNYYQGILGWRYNLAVAALVLGRPEEARAHAREGLRPLGTHTYWTSVLPLHGVLADAHLQLGEVEAAAAVCSEGDRLAEKHAIGMGQPNLLRGRALVHAARGEAAEAAAWLERACVLYAEQDYAWEWARALLDYADLRRTAGAGKEPGHGARLRREAQHLLAGLEGGSRLERLGAALIGRRRPVG